MRIHPEGYRLLFVSFALCAGLAFGSYFWSSISLAILAASCGLLGLFTAYFFRDPHRTPPTEANVLVAPADGLITRIEAAASNETYGAADELQVVSIFLSPLDVHINRSPLAGQVRQIEYRKGDFRIATDNDASHLNEQNIVIIEGEKLTVVCKQIAGVVARRILCWTKVGATLARGEKFGLIRFGSRTDLIMPASVKLVVRVGDRVTGGETIIGRIEA